MTEPRPTMEQAEELARRMTQVVVETTDQAHTTRQLEDGLVALDRRTWTTGLGYAISRGWLVSRGGALHLKRGR